MLSLHDLEQVLVLVKHFAAASSIETFLSSRYYSHVSFSSQLVVCKRRNLVKAFKFSKQSVHVHLAKCETQDLYNTGISDMNESQSWSLPSLNFLSADFTWLDMCIWLPQLNPWLHSGETRYNLNNSCFWLSIFWTFSRKATTNDWKCLNVNRIRSKNFQQNVSEQQLACRWTWSMNAKLRTIEASLASCDEVIATWLRYDK